MTSRRKSARAVRPIELFDWVVLDTQESFYQSPDKQAFIAGEAGRAGYRLALNDRGIVVFVRPSIKFEK